VPTLTDSVGPSGPLIQVLIGVSQPRRQALVAAGQPIPNVETVLGLSDTGASGTCVDRSVIARLGISPRGSTLMHTPSTGPTPHQCSAFDVAFSIPMDRGVWGIPELLVLEADFQHQPIDCLIGMDILSRGFLFFNGVTGTISFAV
jgi:hypothetical protein